MCGYMPNILTSVSARTTLGVIRCRIEHNILPDSLIESFFKRILLISVSS